jgi:ADP-ribose pyrophosphatase YjhB (NUDIX family)
MIEFWDGKSVFCLRVAGVLRRCGYVLVQGAPGGTILPGGRVEMLEQSTTALSREMWEELGVHMEVGRLLWIVENLFDYQGAHVHQVLMIYEMSTDEEITVEKMRAESMRWWPVDRLKRSGLMPAFLDSAISVLPTSVEHKCIV